MTYSDKQWNYYSTWKKTNIWKVIINVLSYTALTLFLLLNKYCKYYQIQNEIVNILYCNDEEVVKEMNAII